jgi:hypothetical protein
MLMVPLRTFLLLCDASAASYTNARDWISTWKRRIKGVGWSTNQVEVGHMTAILLTANAVVWIALAMALLTVQ